VGPSQPVARGEAKTINQLFFIAYLQMLRCGICGISAPLSAGHIQPFG
jgi:hypothetical protein